MLSDKTYSLSEFFDSNRLFVFISAFFVCISAFAALSSSAVKRNEGEP